MSRRAPFGIGVVGLGFMGRTHVQAWQSAAAAGLPCELVAVADPDPARRAGQVAAAGNLGGGASGRLFDPSRVRGHEHARELYADARVDVVSICTYTDSHVELARAALAAGKHVLVEKPVALRARDVKRLLDASARARTLCMPAMCMRFWPGWAELRELVASKRHGRVTSAVFQRLGSGPSWSKAFYGDAARSGGALVDLHIHDADFAYALFGAPARVSTSGSLAHMTTQYRYAASPRASSRLRGAASPHVTAEGAWDLAPGAGFRMRYLVCCERATLEWDLARAGELAVHTAGGTQKLALPAHNGYDGEVRHLLDVVARGDFTTARGVAAARKQLGATLADAHAVARILEAERKSLDTARPVRVRA
ncbi:MAG: Gfo/Idh/MocA family oxidoreductase [Planctomycetota bacterium]|nr:MAG: Gfo/Idh/MocA family oxidoreductase [Planctomycetota bacterium]